MRRNKHRNSAFNPRERPIWTAGIKSCLCCLKAGKDISSHALTSSELALEQASFGDHIKVCLLAIEIESQQSYNQFVTLDQARMGHPLRVVELTATDETEKARLSGLGLRVGMPVVKLMNTPLRDPVECLIGPQLLALERRLLKRIRVEAA